MLIVNEHHTAPGADQYLLYYNTARHRVLGQLTPAQARTRPPQINLAEHRIHRKQVLGGLTTSTRSPPDAPPRCQKKQVTVTIVYSSPTWSRNGRALAGASSRWDCSLCLPPVPAACGGDLGLRHRDLARDLARADTILDWK